MCRALGDFSAPGGRLFLPPVRWGVTENHTEEQPEEYDGPDAMRFEPPTQLYAADEDGVILEPVFELKHGMRAGISNPWATEPDRYLVGVIRGLPGRWLLDIGRSLGKIELQEDGFKVTALVRMAAIAEGLALETAEKTKSFTQRLLKKTAKKTKSTR